MLGPRAQSGRDKRARHQSSSNCPEIDKPVKIEIDQQGNAARAFVNVLHGVTFDLGCYLLIKD